MNRVATDTAVAGIPVRPVWMSFWFALALFSLIVSGIGAAVYVSAKRTVMRTVHDNLESIARIKVGQVERWLERSMNLPVNGALLEDEVAHWIDGGMTAAPGEHLLKHLHGIAEAGKLRAIHLRSAVDGSQLLSTVRHAVDLPQDRELALRAVAARKPVLEDFHREDLMHSGLEVGFHVPLGTDRRGRVHAVAHLQLDAAVSLLPFLDQWPGASASAETLLFRVDGGEIVYLNHSRHEAAPALEMRRPLAEPELLAAQAARGRVGALDGVDYRGVASLGFALPIDGTPWFLIAKIDENEALADLDHMALLATVALLGLMIAFAGWKAEHGRHVETEYRMLFERALQAKRLEFLARYANDGILLADTTGHIIEVNELCAQLYGYGREEMLGMDLTVLWVGGGGPQDVMAADDVVYETQHRRKDRSPLAVEISSRMIDIDGERYFQALVRDVTARRRAEEVLRGSEERASRYAGQLEDLYQNAPCGYHSVDADGMICRMNDTELRWLGYAREEVVGRKRVTDLLEMESCLRFEQRFPIFKREGLVRDIEMVFVRKDGSKHSVLVSATAIYDDVGNFVASRTTVTDVSHLHSMQRERDRQARHVEQLSRHLVAVQEEERRRLACELNDRASPNLAAIKLSLDALSRAQPVEAEDCIADAHALVDDTIAGVREVCADLRPSTLDYAGVMAALVGYTQQYSRRTGIAVRLVLAREDMRLGAEVESTLFRIVQEALNNVVRHAAAATVDIALASDEHSTLLTVKDDGVGFDRGLLSATAPGLRKMRERAEFAGGSFRIVSDPGKGTEIHVELPTPHDVSDSPRHRLTIADATMTLQ